MPLLYRILMRLALVALIVGLAFAYLIMGKDAFASTGTFLGVTVMGALPATALAALAWVVKPPAW